MYAKGMTTGDIEAHIQDIYGLAVSDTTVSRITDKILPVAKEWQQRPLESIYGKTLHDKMRHPVPSRVPLVFLGTYFHWAVTEFRWLIRILKKSKKMGTPISQRKKRQSKTAVAWFVGFHVTAVFAVVIQLLLYKAINCKLSIAT